MKKTLLQIVQSVLSDMDSDEVNSISDTVESLQIAQMVEDCYWELISENEIPEHRELFQLVGLGDTSTPTKMQVPSNVVDIHWIKYNSFTATDTDTDYDEVVYKEPSTFLTMVNGRNVDDSDVDEITDGVIKYLVKNDTAPSYYTSFDDEYLIFDSYDSGVDTTLQTSKSLAYGPVTPTFSQTDDHTPDLDAHLFPVLRNMVKEQAFADLKQQNNQIASRKAHKGMSRAQRRKRRVGPQYNTGPDYGRRVR